MKYSPLFYMFISQNNTAVQKWQNMSTKLWSNAEKSIPRNVMLLICGLRCLNREGKKSKLESSGTGFSPTVSWTTFLGTKSLLLQVWSVLTGLLHSVGRDSSWGPFKQNMYASQKSRTGLYKYAETGRSLVFLGGNPTCLPELTALSGYALSPF